MPVTADHPAPYAPPSSILEIISRRRDRGLTAPINADVLSRAGISGSLIPRTLQSLQTLDLIDETGQPTATFEAIRVAPTPDFQKRMQEWLKSAYADVLAFVDPSKDDESKITDAFRSYEPAGQQRRMVILFRDLCAAAGWAPEKQTPSQKPTTASRPRSGAAQPIRRQAPNPSAKPAPARPTTSIIVGPNTIPAAISGLLTNLPAEGKGWTQEKRDKFLATFQAVLDFCFPIVEQKQEESGAADEAA